MWGHKCCCCASECERLLHDLVHLSRKQLTVAEATLRVEQEQLRVLRRIEFNTTHHTASIGIDFSTPTLESKKEQ